QRWGFGDLAQATRTVDLALYRNRLGQSRGIIAAFRIGPQPSDPRSVGQSRIPAGLQTRLPLRHQASQEQFVMLANFTRTVTLVSGRNLERTPCTALPRLTGRPVSPTVREHATGRQTLPGSRQPLLLFVEE